MDKRTNYGRGFWILPFSIAALIFGGLVWEGFQGDKERAQTLDGLHRVTQEQDQKIETLAGQVKQSDQKAAEAAQQVAALQKQLQELKDNPPRP